VYTAAAAAEAAAGAVTATATACTNPHSQLTACAAAAVASGIHNLLSAVAAAADSSVNCTTGVSLLSLLYAVVLTSSMCRYAVTHPQQQ
jgi:hypothetical protein